MRTDTYAQGLRHTVDVGPTWTVEAVRQVRYHVVTSTNLFAPENTTLLSVQRSIDPLRPRHRESYRCKRRPSWIRPRNRRSGSALT